MKCEKKKSDSLLAGLMEEHNVTDTNVVQFCEEVKEVAKSMSYKFDITYAISK